MPPGREGGEWKPLDLLLPERPTVMPPYPSADSSARFRWLGCLLAMCAGAKNFDHGRLRREIGGARGATDRLGNRRACRLADRAAALADQEHDRIAGRVMMHAGDKSVATLDTMHKALLA